MQTGSSVSYFLTDHLGSTNDLANSSGTVTSSTNYDSFGNATNTSFPSRYQYTGREFDSFTGLYYYRARWYDANLGRFISEDPIGFAGDDVNLYGYTWNNPIKYSDPTGLDGWGNDTADWLDERIEFSRQWYQGDDQEWIRNGLINTGADLAFGSSEMLRVGSGTAQAFCDCDENIYGRAAFLAMDIQRASGLFALLGGAGVRLSGGSQSQMCRFSGTDKPWRSGATPDSVYTHIDPKTGKAIQNAVYDGNGNVIGHVDFKNHGLGAQSGHGHMFPRPGDPSSGHGAGNPHIPHNQLPSGWGDLPNGVPPRTPIGQ